jgi:hypothetical protein
MNGAQPSILAWSHKFSCDSAFRGTFCEPASSSIGDTEGLSHESGEDPEPTWEFLFGKFDDWALVLETPFCLPRRLKMSLRVLGLHVPAERRSQDVIAI